MILRVTTDNTGRTSIKVLGAAFNEVDSLEGDRAIVLRQAEMVWGIEIRDDGDYSLF